VLFADEIISMVKYMIRPLRFDDQSVALDLIEKVGPGGNFIAEDHTAAHFKRNFWFPRFLDRRMFELWQKEGSGDIRSVLNRKAREIFEDHSPVPLSEAKRRSITNILYAHQPDTG
jgi:trimethylamine--corrinoid protein Co-methyltransferase